MSAKSVHGRRYPAELRERAVRMVREAIAENGAVTPGSCSDFSRAPGI